MKRAGLREAGKWAGPEAGRPEEAATLLGWSPRGWRWGWGSRAHGQGLSIMSWRVRLLSRGRKV